MAPNDQIGDFIRALPETTPISREISGSDGIENQLKQKQLLDKKRSNILQEWNDKFGEKGISVFYDEGTGDLRFHIKKTTNAIFSVPSPSEERDGFKIMKLGDMLSMVYDGLNNDSVFDPQGILYIDGKIAIKPAKKEEGIKETELKARNDVRKRYAENIHSLIQKLKVN